MNIAEILKYCPKGTKLYSTIYGEVTLNNIYIGKDYPIKVITYNIDTPSFETSFTKEGHYMKSIPNGECILFPSKEQRDWNKFRLPVKDGDIMMKIDGTSPFIATGEMHKDISPMYICGINTLGNFQISFNEGGWTTDFYIPASEEAKKELFYKMTKAGYKWNADTLELEKIIPKFKEDDVISNEKGSIYLVSKVFDKGNTLEMAAVLNKEGLIINPNVWQHPHDKSIASEEDRNKLFSAMTKGGYKYDKEQHKLIKQEFKPFDKVLVRDYNYENWKCSLFSHYQNSNETEYIYVTMNGSYIHCIPYKGNEYLLNKTDNPQ